MRKSLIIALCCMAFVFRAQDTFFMSDGTVKTGILLSISRDYVFYKATDTSAAIRLQKRYVVMVEDYQGNIHAIGTDYSKADAMEENSQVRHQNIISVQPLGLFIGRGTFVYERINPAGNVGVVVPVVLSYNYGFGRLFFNTRGRSSSIGFASGIDINFYIRNPKNDRVCLFVGPRLRYGTDASVVMTEGFTAQTQFGWRFGSVKGVSQHVSVGVGFMKVFASSSQLFTNEMAFHAWYSVNYRIGVRW